MGTHWGGRKREGEGESESPARERQGPPFTRPGCVDSVCQKLVNPVTGFQVFHQDTHWYPFAGEGRCSSKDSGISVGEGVVTNGFHGGILVMHGIRWNVVMRYTSK